MKYIDRHPFFEFDDGGMIAARGEGTLLRNVMLSGGDVDEHQVEIRETYEATPEVESCGSYAE